MKKYRVVMSYVMALDKEVMANSEEEAEEKGQDWIDSLSNEKFAELGEPQHENTDVWEV